MSRKDQVRDRVLEMFAKSDRKIAQSLIDDEIVTPAKRLNSAQRARWEDGVRRTVNNHRRKLMESWALTPLPKPGDPAEARAFIAKCQTRINELDDIVDDKNTKSTARMNAYAEIRQLDTLIAQTKRVDTGGRRRSEDEGEADAPQSKLPFVGVVMDLKNVSQEARAEIERELREGRTDAGTDATPASARSETG
jgi:hypothetical protein